jgi:hypothetical protein
VSRVLRTQEMAANCEEKVAAERAVRLLGVQDDDVWKFADACVVGFPVLVDVPGDGNCMLHAIQHCAAAYAASYGQPFPEVGGRCGALERDSKQPVVRE